MKDCAHRAVSTFTRHSLAHILNCRGASACGRAEVLVGRRRGLFESETETLRRDRWHLLPHQALAEYSQQRHGVIHAYLAMGRGIDVSYIGIGEEIMILILLSGAPVLTGYHYLLLMMMGYETVRHQYHDSCTHQYSGDPFHTAKLVIISLTENLQIRHLAGIDAYLPEQVFQHPHRADQQKLDVFEERRLFALHTMAPKLEYPCRAEDG